MAAALGVAFIVSPKVEAAEPAMKKETVFGLRCAREEEKALVKRVDGYLAQLHRTTSRETNRQMLDGFKPLEITHFYWNLNKDTATFVEIYPNVDVKGRRFFPDRPEFGWLMRALIHLDTFPAGTQEKAETFIRGLLDATGCGSVVLREGDGEAPAVRGSTKRP